MSNVCRRITIGRNTIISGGNESFPNFSIGFVARPKPEIFDITKRKFHNVLQGVADPSVRLEDSDKEAFIEWSNDNVKRFWGDRGGPLQNSDVIIIDDPQGNVKAVI
jgi:hypothetical protein